MDSVRITSIQAPIADPSIFQITTYLGETLGIETTFIQQLPWQERERLLDQDQIQIGWICGLPYVQKVARETPSIELLAAPVMMGQRYRKLPIYFSDVVVHRNSQYRSFSDLSGATWAYNEPNSHSGYNLVKYHLALIGKRNGFFGRVIEAGSHQKALDMIIKRKIDAAAIDSTVLELELDLRPKLENHIRIIETLGPSPIPPWVISKSVPIQLKERIQNALIGMHLHLKGQKILMEGQMHSFVSVTDQDYDPIRAMKNLADTVSW